MVKRRQLKDGQADGYTRNNKVGERTATETASSVNSVW